MNPCYIMTFVLGGFSQALARSLRQLLRPFFLPPGSMAPRLAAPQSHPVSLKKLPPPPQTILKRLYDLASIVATQLVLNFIVVPFIVLEISSSLAVWATIAYYGAFLIFIPLLGLNFLGGAKFLKRALKRRDERASKNEREGKTEGEERVRYEQAVEEKRLRRGEGVPALGLEPLGLDDSDEEKKEIKKER